MNVVLFCHSLISDWNHGNAHFLRGVAAELLDRGHRVRAFEPRDGWSLTNLVADAGRAAVDEIRQAFPHLRSTSYADPAAIDLDDVLDDADVVIVHEWNDPVLVRRIGEHRSSAAAPRERYLLFFHDTHHRSVTDPAAMAAMDLRHYDAVLAYGNAVRDAYLKSGWHRHVFTWHEAADARVFRPIESGKAGDLVWVGNWGDDERAAEIEEFLVRPARDLKLRARVFGVRYPQRAIDMLAEAGVEYGGYLANHRVPATFAEYRLTIHVPRRPYVRALPGIPTIRPFEAMACAVPLVSAPWSDVEGLFTPGEDFLFAADGNEMKRHLRALLDDRKLADGLARRGRATVEARHTCKHRVTQLLEICKHLDGEPFDSRGEERGRWE